MKTHIFIFLSFAVLSCPSSPTTAEEMPRKGTAAKATVKITVSKETTYLLGPLKADGAVDYVAALNARLGQGVTPENNAAIPLLRAIGPSFLPGPERAEILKRLGMPPLVEKGNYWSGREPWQDVLKASEAPGSERDYPAVAAWLKANEGPLALVVEATKRPRFWIPFVEGSGGVLGPVPSLVTLNAIGRALAARAMRKLHAGDTASVRADLLAVHRLARLIALGPMMIEWAIGVAIDTRASRSVSALAKSGKITAREARLFLSELRALAPFPDLFDAVYQFERLVTLSIVSGFPRATPNEWKSMADMLEAPGMATVRPSDVDWDEALRAINQWFDRWGAVRGKPTFVERRDALEAFGRDLEDAKKRARQTLNVEGVKQLHRAARDPAAARSALGRAFGTLVCCEALSAGTVLLPYQAETWFRVNQATLALAAYRAEKGSYPTSLEALRPGYMPEVPNDPFTDRPLSYERRGGGYLLYSVGPDLKPDTAAGAKTGDDIVVQVE